VRAVLALAVVVPLLAGCGVEDDTQRFARESVESYLANEPAYDGGEVRCTDNPQVWLAERQASVVICAARKTSGGCDWFRVDLVPVGARVKARIRLESPDAGCVLPP
jgi:hypothetical protein